MRFERESLDEDNLVFLPPEAQEELLRWCEILVADGYNLGSSTQIWESASYLVANDHTGELSEEPLNVGETACILAFAAEQWPEIKALLTETDNGAEPAWNSPNINPKLEASQYIPILGAISLILLLGLLVKLAKLQTK